MRYVHDKYPKMKMKSFFAAFLLVVLALAVTSCYSSRRNGCPATWTSNSPVSKNKS